MSLPVIAITGANGYVGSVLAASLAGEMSVIRLVRVSKSPSDIEWSFEAERDIAGELEAHGVETLLHVAWDMKASTRDEAQRISVEGSRRLYDSARRAGVKRSVFISSISAFEGCRSVYGRTKLEVEQLTKAAGGVVFRPGLIHGDSSGGVFGSLRAQIDKSRVVPMIGDGAALQYLLDEKTLAGSVRRACLGEFDSAQGAPITIANATPVPFRELLLSLAQGQNRKITLLPTPWRLLYAGLRAAEVLGLPAPFRSDSVISFVHQNRSPDFSLQNSYGIEPARFDLTLPKTSA